MILFTTNQQNITYAITRTRMGYAAIREVLGETRKEVSIEQTVVKAVKAVLLDADKRDLTIKSQVDMMGPDVINPKKSRATKKARRLAEDACFEEGRAKRFYSNWVASNKFSPRG